MELSLCMIVRNEEKCLARCLDSVRGAVEEIIILDTGSTDATKEIARRYTDRVEDYVWQDDFSSARNASMAMATKPYILWLDADDVLESAEREKLIALKRRLDGSVDAVMTPYHYAHEENGEPTLIFERERIVRREAGFRFEGVVHEAMTVGGVVWHEDIVVRHTGEHGESSAQRNLAIYEKWRSKGMTFTPRDRYYYARELLSCGHTERALEAFEAYLALGQGMKENIADAHLLRGRCLFRLGRLEEARCAYLFALGMGLPGAQPLCALGEICMQAERYEEAVFWYRAALLCGVPSAGLAFVQPQWSGYVPLMQLCVCYDRLGQKGLASQMNERALLARPNDRAALENRAYFQRMLQKEENAQQGRR